MPTIPGIQRLFVAAYPPLSVAAELLALLDPFELPPHVAAPTEQLHLTIQFIGNIGQRRLSEVVESVARSVAGVASFVLQSTTMRTLPSKGPPRLIALETDAPAPLMEIHRRLVHRLARNPREEAARGYLPHVTLARFKVPAPGLSIAVPSPPVVFAINEIKLMRSRLRSRGAIHETVEAFPLG